MMAGIFSLILGLFLLLITFGFSTLVGPGLQGVDWWRAIFRMMLGPGLFALTLGLTALAGGFYLIATSRDQVPTRQRPTVTIRWIMLAVAILAILLAAYVLTPGPTIHLRRGPQTGTPAQSTTDRHGSQ
jgi:hypothetical protein